MSLATVRMTARCNTIHTYLYPRHDRSYVFFSVTSLLYILKIVLCTLEQISVKVFQK